MEQLLSAAAIFLHSLWDVFLIASTLLGLPAHLIRLLRRLQKRGRMSYTVYVCLTVATLLCSIGAGALELCAHAPVSEALPEDPGPVLKAETPGHVSASEGQPDVQVPKEAEPVLPVSTAPAYMPPAVPVCAEEAEPEMPPCADLLGCPLQNAVKTAYDAGILCISYLPPFCPEGCILLCTGQRFYFDADGSPALWLDWEAFPVFLADDDCTFPDEDTAYPEDCTYFDDFEDCDVYYDDSAAQ